MRSRQDRDRARDRKRVETIERVESVLGKYAGRDVDKTVLEHARVGGTQTCTRGLRSDGVGYSSPRDADRVVISRIRTEPLSASAETTQAGTTTSPNANPSHEIAP